MTEKIKEMVEADALTEMNLEANLDLDDAFEVTDVPDTEEQNVQTQANNKADVTIENTSEVDSSHKKKKKKSKKS